MNSTQTTDFKQPLPIDNTALNYLKTRLNIADTIKVWDKTAEEQKYDYDYSGIGNIKVYEDSNLGPTIQFSPIGWSCIYDKYAGNILKHLYNCTSNLNFENKIVYSNKPDKGKSISLTFNESEECQLYLDAKGVKIHTEEGIDILQTVWNRTVSDFNKECYSLAEQFKLPLVFDDKSKPFDDKSKR